MSRLQNIFKACSAEHRKALIAYLTVGTPDLNASEKIIQEVINAGADIIELGVPFSDPTADGSVIQEAAQTALRNHVTITDVLDLAARLRQRNPTVGLIVFSYYNVIFNLSVDKFTEQAAHAGVDGVLTVDLPFEESAEIQPALAARQMDWIALVSPLTDCKRAAKLLKNATGFVYYIMQLGVTGVRAALPPDAAQHLAMLKKISPVPVAAGFGVAGEAMAREVARIADGVIVGSAFVKLQLHSPDPAGDAGRLAAELARAVR